MQLVKTVSLQWSLFFCFMTFVTGAGKAFALSATDTIQAESFSGQSGVTAESCSEGGQDVTSIQNGDYIYFNDVDFGDAGIQCFEARTASYGPGAYPGTFIEVHLDSLHGALIGTCEILPITGGWQTWVSKACQIAGASGVHTVYLDFIGAAGALFSLNWIKFHGTPSYLNVGWRSTSNSARGKWRGTLPFSAAAGDPAILVFPDTMYQRIDGWGGAFNDNGAATIDSLSPTARSTVMRELFDPVGGCKFNIGRVPIGISDFSLVAGYYSLDETSGDFNMTKFSIHHDSLYNIPYIKEAMKWQPNMMIYGSVWTPPTWMKNPTTWQGPAQFNQSAQYWTAYALYFRKFVQAWQKAGISVFAVYPQNEPGWNVAGQPACGWTGTQMKDWAKNYLCPDFTANNINTQVWMGNFFTNNFGPDIQPTLDDSVARIMIRGCGLHREAYASMKQAMDTANALGLHWHAMQDETMCWSGANSWTDAMNTCSYLDSFFVGGTNSYMFWNMILNSNSNFGWQSRAQNSMITINTSSKAVTYTGEFYIMKHWSYYIAQGAARIQVTNSNTNLTACGFKNPDGSIILEVQNKSASAVSPIIQVGVQSFTPTLAASSVNTFIIGGAFNTHDWTPGIVSGLQYTPLRRDVSSARGAVGVYDIKGRLIKALDRSVTATKSNVLWDRTDATGRKATPGLYITVNRFGGNSSVQKVMCQ
jgi:glucosylceramidase